MTEIEELRTEVAALRQRVADLEARRPIPSRPTEWLPQPPQRPWWETTPRIGWPYAPPVMS